MKLVIIGNGVAGNNAALAARRADASCDITILSKEPYAEYAAGALPDFIAGFLERDRVIVKSSADYKKLAVKLKSGADVKCVDLKRKRVAAILQPGDKPRDISFDKLIIATGSFPIAPPVEGHKLPGNFVLKNVSDASSIMEYPAKSAVIVGSGAIGIETALALRARGVGKVYVIEMLDRIFPKSFDLAASSIIREMLEQSGIHVYTGEQVKSVSGTRKVTGVVTSKRSIPSQMVIWAIGVRPDVALAKETGIELGQTGGVLTDEFMRTNIEDVYACGDCAQSTDIITGRRVLNFLWESASRQGRTAGANAAGESVPFGGSFAVMLSYIGETPIFAVGETEQSLEGLEYQVWERKTRLAYRRALILDGRLAGVQMVGTLDGAGPFLYNLRRRLDEHPEPPARDLASLIVYPNLVKGFLSGYIRSR